MLQTSETIEEVAVRDFIEAINAQDFDAMFALMAEDHTFIDSCGTTVVGRDAVLTGWPSYFAMFPDFQIAVEKVIQDGSELAIFGSWSATYVGKHGKPPENAVGGPAAWQSTVEDGQVAKWQVYADHTHTLEVMKQCDE